MGEDNKLVEQCVLENSCHIDIATQSQCCLNAK